MKQIIYLPTFYPRIRFLDILSKLKSSANLSADTFSYSILTGLSRSVRNRLTVINTPLLGPYPFKTKELYTHRVISTESDTETISIGICNVYIWQNISISNSLKKELMKLDIHDGVILIYSTYLPLLHAAVWYKRKFPKIKIVLIVPDLIEDISSNNPCVKNFKKLLFGDFNDLCYYVDAFVYISEYMHECMPVKKISCVVEGFCDSSLKRQVTPEKNLFTIFYSGMLYEKFGVKNLIDAFTSIKNPDMRLKLCGGGELVEYINSISSIDPRVEYIGILPHDKVLELQSKVSLLVNPRQPIGRYTRYSFPSKNIEYLASGVPTLIYELDGIPSEYYDYCYHLSASQLSVSHLTNMIKRIYEKPYEERASIAEKAQRFILRWKNEETQVSKIINLINSL